jgi:hypothetical protein
VTVTEFWCFLATAINIGIIGIPNIKYYWSQEWSYLVPFFNYIFSRDRFMQIFWMLQLSPTPSTTGPLTRTKSNLYRLKAIDANKKLTIHLQFRWKLVEELSADRMAVRGSKKRGRPFSNDGAKRLDGKQHFIYTNETAIPKTVQCVRIVKSRVGIMKLCIIAQHAPANLDLILDIVLNYTTRR